MKETKNYIAVDLGASNGRVLLGKWDGERFELEELHRFENGPVNVLGHLYWDVFRLWSDIKTGLARYASRFSEPPAGVGVNTWGVDYALLDAKGNLLGNPFNYRDSRTDGMMDAVFEKVSKKEVFDRTGIQFMQLNTIFQLYSMVKENHPHLEYAETLLMMPDLFHYWLSGIKAVEYTDASTSQLFDARERRWSTEILSKLGIPEESAEIRPCTVVLPGVWLVVCLFGLFGCCSLLFVVFSCLVVCCVLLCCGLCWFGLIWFRWFGLACLGLVLCFALLVVLLCFVCLCCSVCFVLFCLFVCLLCFACLLCCVLFGGYGLDYLFHTRPWLMIVGFILGSVAGFRSLFRLLEQENKKKD